MPSSPASLPAIIPLALFSSIAAAGPGGDIDRNGKISLAAFQAAAQKRLMRADKDADSKISLQEWLARPAARKARRDPSKRFGRLDVNHDGQLDTDEIDRLAKRLFAILDKDADGAISDEERLWRKTKIAPDPAADDVSDGAAFEDEAEPHTKQQNPK
jgi:hypothetical protein